MSDLKNALQKRLEENYAAYAAQLTKKSFAGLIDAAEEIAAAKYVCEHLAEVCTDEDAALLLRFDNPLEVMRDRWLEETGVDRSEEISHMIWTVQDQIDDFLSDYPPAKVNWQIREDGLDKFEQQDTKPIGPDEIAIDPVMDFSSKEIVACIEIGFDVGSRFQVYPNIDDTCDLFAKYDPVAQALRAELCIKTYDGETQWNEHWVPVELLPSEQEMIVGLMEEICQKDIGKSLRDTWLACHPAVNRKNLHGKKNERCQHER